jgi:hypothetical protein
MGYRFVEPVFAPVDGRMPGRCTAEADVHTATLLDVDICHALARTVLQGHEDGQSWASKTRYAPGSSADWDINGSFRRSRNIAPELPGLERAFGAMENKVRRIQGDFGLDPDLFTLRRVDDQCLIYFQGDHIGDHADDAASTEDEEGQLTWHVIKPQRHVVAIMWLTGQEERLQGAGSLAFTGGELRFNSLLDEVSGEPLVIAPAPGKMVAFPASAWFRHEVLPVRSGVRIAVTRWWEAVRLSATRAP